MIGVLLVELRELLEQLPALGTRGWGRGQSEVQRDALAPRVTGGLKLVGQHRELRSIISLRLGIGCVGGRGHLDVALVDLLLDDLRGRGCSLRELSYCLMRVCPSVPILP